MHWQGRDGDHRALQGPRCCCWPLLLHAPGRCRLRRCLGLPLRVYVQHRLHLRGLRLPRIRPCRWGPDRLLRLHHGLHVVDYLHHWLLLLHAWLRYNHGARRQGRELRLLHSPVRLLGIHGAVSVAAAYIGCRSSAIPTACPALSAYVQNRLWSPARSRHNTTLCNVPI